MRNFSVDFGIVNANLTTVGYTQLKLDGTVAVARSTSGVVDYGSGAYGAQIQLDAACSTLRWDTGTATPLVALEDVALLPGASFGGTTVCDVPNSPLAVSSAVRLVSETLPGGAMGKNGRVDFQLQFKNYSGGAATAYVTLGGQIIYAGTFSYPLETKFSITNRNSTQAQYSSHYLQNRKLPTLCNTDVDLPLEVYVQKANAADDVSLRRFTYQIYYNNETQVEASYLTTSGVMEVTESDLLLPTLPPRVTGDPQKSIRSLASGDYQFPTGFFSVASKTWPLRESTLPVPTSLLRTRDWPGTGWQAMQTAQATAAYPDPVTGPVPPGISASGLADLDALFAAADSRGVTPVVNLLFDDITATPAWVAALGGAFKPLSIPPAGQNRVDLFASIYYYTQYIIQRYTGRYQTMTWYIQPLDDPMNTWSGLMADMVALIDVVNSAVATYGGGKVMRLCTAWTGIDQATNYNKATTPLKETFHYYTGNGGWWQFDVFNYNIYGGDVWLKDITPDAPQAYQPANFHNLKVIDPTVGTAPNDLCSYAWVIALVGAYVGAPPTVPGESVAGRPLWVTGGEAYAGTRDKNFFIRLALIASALGVSKYIFDYYGGLRYGSLPSMDIENCRQAYTDANDFLSGKTINFVNVTDDFSRVGAGIDGVAYLF